ERLAEIGKGRKVALKFVAPRPFLRNKKGERPLKHTSLHAERLLPRKVLKPRAVTCSRAHAESPRIIMILAILPLSTSPLSFKGPLDGAPGEILWGRAN